MERHELRVFFDAKIPMCGCGNPEEGVALIHEVLKLHPPYDHRAELEAILPSDGIQMVVLGLIDDVGLNEHGGSIGGSWLTPLGERASGAKRRSVLSAGDERNHLRRLDSRLGGLLLSLSARRHNIQALSGGLMNADPHARGHIRVA
jgi:hypothetical protein